MERRTTIAKRETVDTAPSGDVGHRQLSAVFSRVHTLGFVEGDRRIC